ncbi:MAG: sarcosine oxidase subunit gamma [Halioglobus sp.]|jgi:sarcosine oxidase subunit gamma
MSEQSESVNREGVYIESALHYFSGMRSGNQPPSIIIREARSLGHLVIRGDASNQNFLAGIEQVLGIKLPVKPRSSSISSSPLGSSLYWLGPGEWLLLVDGETESQVEEKLRQVLTGHFSVTIVTGGQTLINISGPNVDSVLKKSSVYDFHPNSFKVNECVQTTFAKATALFCRRENGSFDVVIRRSFADYLARWLLDAGEEFGCSIE